MIVSPHHVRSLLLVLALAAAAAVPADQDWSNYDWSQEEIVLGAPGRTTDESIAIAREAVANSRMQITMSAVGFDIREGSTAEVYLQRVADVGRGAYFRAEVGGQLAQVMDYAATGQRGMVVAGGPEAVQIHTPREGETVGPSVVVSGRTQPGALVVIYTIPFRADTGEELKSVPGARRQAEADGSFTVRIAMPRVAFGATDARVSYQIRAHVARPDGSTGPESQVDVVGQQP